MDTVWNAHHAAMEDAASIHSTSWYALRMHINYVDMPHRAVHLC
jgi:hypothetical protein